MIDRKNRKQLIVFVKNLEAGEVKTRLAASVGNEKALEVYKELLRITAEITKSVESDKVVSYSKYVEESDSFSSSVFKKTVQSGVDLGERMMNAFCQGFSAGNSKVVLIGSDCPDITPEIIQQAFHELETVDCVLGPSDDGGYYLVGLSRFIPEIFENMSWSVDSVFDETVKRLDYVSASYKLLPALNDIDNKEDLLKSRLSL